MTKNNLRSLKLEKTLKTLKQKKNNTCFSISIVMFILDAFFRGGEEYLFCTSKRSEQRFIYLRVVLDTKTVSLYTYSIFNKVGKIKWKRKI